MRWTAGLIVIGIVTGVCLSLAARGGFGSPGAPAPHPAPIEDGANCTALILDRATGLTVAAACRASRAPQLEAAVRAVRT